MEKKCFKTTHADYSDAKPNVLKYGVIVTRNALEYEGYHLCAFNYLGSKSRFVGEIIPFLPRSHTYIEGCGGSGSVMWAKKPSKIEIFNDIDHYVVNFFKVLRKYKDVLIEKLRDTPYSHKEYRDAHEYLLKTNVNVDPIESAKCFFITVQMSFLGKPILSGFSRTFTTSRKHMARPVSAYHSKVEALYQVTDRLKRVIFEDMDVIRLVKLITFKDTTLYLDPPYPEITRSSIGDYKHDQHIEFHKNLLEAVLKCPAKYVTISSYENDLYDTTLDGWNKHKFTYNGGAMIKEREECLYYNFGESQSILDQFTQ